MLCSHLGDDQQFCIDEFDLQYQMILWTTVPVNRIVEAVRSLTFDQSRELLKKTGSRFLELGTVPSNILINARRTSDCTLQLGITVLPVTNLGPQYALY